MFFVGLSLGAFACGGDNGEGDPCVDDDDCKADLVCCYEVCEAVGDEELCLEACSRKMECRSSSDDSDYLDRCETKCRDEPCKRDDVYNGCIVKAADCEAAQTCQPGVGQSDNPEIPL